MKNKISEMTPGKIAIESMKEAIAYTRKKRRKEQTFPQPLRLTESQQKVIEREARRLDVSKARLLNMIVLQHIDGGQYEQAGKETS